MKSFIAATCLGVLMSGIALPASAITCREPNKPASVVGTPKIEFPSNRNSPAHGTTVLKLDISAHGELVGHEVMESSGNPNFDLAAFRAAHQMKYTPELINCKPVAGTYLFVVVFPE